MQEIGADYDEAAGRFGISADRAANYNNDHVGAALNYEVLAEMVCEMRVAGLPSVSAGKSALMRTMRSEERSENPRAKRLERTDLCRAERKESIMYGAILGGIDRCAV